MKPWWQVAVPHKDIREGRLEEAVFAASLGDVTQGKGPIDYRDPETFFRKTYFTSGLTNLIGVVLSKLSGQGKGNTVIQIQTPFGGGKTHALLALYHTFKNGDKLLRLDVIKRILKENKVDNIPETRVVVFVREYADPLRGRTLWGEIAHQLGCYELMKEYDEKKVAPGKGIVEKMLSENKPVLILMDELLQYIVRAMGVKVEEGTLKGQVQAFIKSLTEAISAADRCALVATLPSSVSEGFEEAERAERILSELQKIFGRVERIYTPVEGEEIYEIIRKRLFEELGDISDHRAVADEYFGLYQKLGDDIPSECKEISYREKMIKAYPFHPEAIDVLFERWATIPTFQRTRGALRLLAEVIADLYKREHPAPLIQPSDINFMNTAIRREFVKHIGNEFESVISADINGMDAKAPKIDREMGTEYSKYKVATGLATSIFFYSFSGGERRGATAQRLRLAFLHEGIPPAIVSDALRRLEDQLWFLHFEKNLYYFSSVVGLNRVIIDREEAVKIEDIEEEFRERIDKVAGNDFDVFIWPNSNSDIPDNKKIKLVVLSQKYMAGDDVSGQFITDIIDRHSTGFRTYKNTLIFLVADPNEYEGFRSTTRRFLALNSIKGDKVTMERLAEEDRERVDQKLKDANSSASTRLISVYRHVAKASKEGTKTFILGIPTVGERLSLTKRVKDHLRDQEAILDKISPKVLLERTFSKEDERKNVAEVWEAFLKFPELPILESEHVIKDAVIQGVQNEVFGLLIDDKIHYAELIPSAEEIPEEANILRKEIAQKMKEKAGEVTTEVTQRGILGEALRPKLPEGGVRVPPEGIRNLVIRAIIPWDKLSELVRGVFTPLSREGAQITLEVKIEARSEHGIKKETLDLKIKETLNQIGAKMLEEKEE